MKKPGSVWGSFVNTENAKPDLGFKMRIDAHLINQRVKALSFFPPPDLPLFVGRPPAQSIAMALTAPAASEAAPPA